MEYSKVAESMQASPIRAMMVKAAAKKGVISLSPGQPDFPPEKRVVEKAKEMLDKSYMYAPGAGIDELRQTYIEYLNKEIGTDYTMEDTMVTVGGMSAVHLSLCSILNPGDEVLVAEPYFTNYEGMIQMNNGVPVKVKTTEEDNFAITVEQIKEAITPKTKALLINSPCNPTGQVLSLDTLKDIAKLALENDFFVITDEVYRHVIYDDAEFYSIASLPGMKENVIIVDSCSKGCAMPGYRVGFLTGPKELITLASKLIENVYSCASTDSQYAAIEAIKYTEDYREYMRSEYQKRRDYLCERIDKIDKISCIKPQGAFYLYVNVKETGLTGEEFANQLLEKESVAIVPGISFGESGMNYVRISFATSMDNLVESFDRIERFVGGLS